MSKWGKGNEFLTNQILKRTGEGGLPKMLNKNAAEICTSCHTDLRKKTNCERLDCEKGKNWDIQSVIERFKQDRLKWVSRLFLANDKIVSKFCVKYNTLKKMKWLQWLKVHSAVEI